MSKGSHSFSPLGRTNYFVAELLPGISRSNISKPIPSQVREHFRLRSQTSRFRRLFASSTTSEIGIWPAIWSPAPVTGCCRLERKSLSPGFSRRLFGGQGWQYGAIA